MITCCFSELNISCTVHLELLQLVWTSSGNEGKQSSFKLLQRTTLCQKLDEDLEFKYGQESSSYDLEQVEIPSAEFGIYITN